MPESNLHVPQTVEDMRPPKQSTLITEASNFLRAHWEEVKGFYLAISGEAPSIHGKAMLDEAACVFKIKEIATTNGYAFLASVRTDKLRSALRYGYKRNSGHSVRMLEKQGNRVRLTERQRAAN